jgi:hypothetical protein
VLIALTSPLARGELCKLLLRRRWRTLGGRGTSLRRSTPAAGVTDAFFAEAGCASDSCVARAGFLNGPGFAVSGAFAASLGVTIGTEVGFSALGGSNEVGGFVGFGCTVPTWTVTGSVNDSELTVNVAAFLVTGMRTSGDNLLLRSRLL